MDYRRSSLSRRRPEPPAPEPSPIAVHVQSGESRFVRSVAVMNLFVSTVLAGAALWIGQQYHAEERVRSDKERAEERVNRSRDRAEQKVRDAESARELASAAKHRCVDLTLKAIEAVRGNSRISERLDALSFLGLIDEDCRRVGEPIARLIGDEEALSRAQPPEVRRSIAALRRKLAAPLPVPPNSEVDAIVTSSAETLENVGDLVDIAAYGGGAVMTGTGLLNFKKHVDNPGVNELRKPLDSNAFEANF